MKHEGNPFALFALPWGRRGARGEWSREKRVWRLVKCDHDTFTATPYPAPNCSDGHFRRLCPPFSPFVVLCRAVI